jgi:hypothetical protein
MLSFEAITLHKRGVFGCLVNMTRHMLENGLVFLACIGVGRLIFTIFYAYHASL